jgi:3-phytase
VPLRQWNVICTKEIEAIAVDSELGFVYYGDENYGIRK